MVEQTVIHPCHGILVSNKSTYQYIQNGDKCPGNYVEWEKKQLIPKGTYCIILFIEQFRNHRITETEMILEVVRG